MSHIRVMTGAILLSQGLTSLIALALPPLLSTFIPARYPGSPAWMAAAGSVAPLIGAVIGGPIWGHVSDVWGRKLLLVRAHLGFGLSCLALVFAPTAALFIAALGLQGFAGGSYAASRAYLIESTPSGNASRALFHLELCPRFAAVFGPLLLAYGLRHHLRLQNISPEIVGMPVFCALVIAALPINSGLADTESKISGISNAKPRPISTQKPTMTWGFIMLLSCLHIWGGAFVAPYLVVWLRSEIPGMSLTSATAYSILPHAAFLLAALWSRRSNANSQHANFSRLIFGLGIQYGALLALALVHGLAAFLILRVAYTALYLCNWNLLNSEIAQALSANHPGRRSGELDAAQRLTTMIAALGAALTWSNPEIGAPSSNFVIWAGLSGLVILAGLAAINFRESLRPLTNNEKKADHEQRISAGYR